jgi:heat shock protein HtpX
MTANSLKTVVLLALLAGLLVFAGRVIAGPTGMFVALVMALLMNFFAYWFSDRVVQAMTGARELPYEEAPWLHELVAQLAYRAGIPKPRLWLVDAPQPNAFATGRDPNYGAVAVTTGLLHLLNRDELAGVIAHELAHIKHRDTLIQAVVATIAGAISYLAQMAQWALFFGGFGRSDEREGNGLGELAASLLFVLLAPIAALIIQLAISRAREYEADAGGARISGDPLALASALERLEAASRLVPMEVNPAASHLFIVQPFSGEGLLGLFSTHPPIRERVARLRRMAMGARA